MADFTGYLLRSDQQIAEFKDKLKDKLPGYQEKIRQYLQHLPGTGSWICFGKNVPPKNITIIIGLICIYIQENWNPNDIIEFNSTVTMIRRKVSESNHKKSLTYAEYRAKIQNNDGRGRQ